MSDLAPDTRPAQDGVAAVDRALKILSAFRSNEKSLTLADLAARAGLNKSTILRLTQSLIEGRLLVRGEDGSYRIGPEALRLGTIFQESHSVSDTLLPRMRELAHSTGESVVFHVQDGVNRVCLLRVESDQPIRHHVREGDVIPLELGSGGKIIFAFTGRAGEPYDTIRRDLHYASLGERSPDTSAIAAPVFGSGQRLMGSLAVSGPSFRVTGEFARRIVPDLLTAAMMSTRELGGDEKVFATAITAAREKASASR